MAKTATAPEQLSKGAKVVARVDLREVPQGTAGRVSMINGMTWIRYWVQFENGVWLGSISRDKLATPDQWKRFLNGEEEAETSTAAEGGETEAAAADDGGGGGKTAPGGAFVSQKLLDRSAAARARLTGG